MDFRRSLLLIFLILPISAQRSFHCRPEPEAPLCVTISNKSESSSQKNNDNWQDRKSDRPDRSNGNFSVSTSGSSRVQSSGRLSQSPANITETPTQKIVIEALKTHGGFSKLAINNQGKIPFSIMQDFKLFAIKSGHVGFIWYGKPDGNGHHYVAVHYMGRGEDMARTLDILKNRLYEVFPIFNFENQNSLSEIKVGEQYQLTLTGIRGYRILRVPVSVSEESPISFTLTPLPGHPFRGSVTHGVITDSNGIVWLFQEGFGDKDENPMVGVNNNAIAQIMWAGMATNIYEKLHPKRTPSQSKEIK